MSQKTVYGSGKESSLLGLQQRLHTCIVLVEHLLRVVDFLQHQQHLHALLILTRYCTICQRSAVFVEHSLWIVEDVTVWTLIYGQTNMCRYMVYDYWAIESAHPLRIPH